MSNTTNIPAINKPSLYVTYKAWIPKQTLTADSIKDIKKRYTINRYDENTCRNCSNLPHRHNELCDECPRGAFIDILHLYKERIIKNLEYIGLPVGDKKYYKNFGVDFSDYKVVDNRITAPFNHDIKFTANLYDYQTPVVDQYLKAKYGMMQCPPRTGKSAMAIYIATHFGQRTLILANQHEFLKQIENHIRSMTNIGEIEAITGKKLVGFAKTVEEYDQFLFCMATYQKFISEKGKKLLAVIKRNYGTVIIDEAHGVAALKFAETIGLLYPRYLLGMTATPERKDKRHIITERIIGPVTALSKRESLPVTLSVFETPVPFKKSYVNFVFAMRFLSRHEARNEYILNHIIHDLKANPQCSIVMPLMFKEHVVNMAKAINEAMGCSADKPIAEIFVGGGTAKNKQLREDTLNRARSGQTRVIVGIRKLLQLGVDCPAWNMLYEVMPIANRPMLYQETSRIRTPHDKQPDKSPRIKFFVDIEIGQSLGCFRATMGHLRQAEFSDYHWTENSKEKLRNILHGGGKFYGKDIDVTTEQGYNKAQAAKSPGNTLFDTKLYAGVDQASSRRRRL